MDSPKTAQRPRQGVLVVEDDPTRGANERAVLRPDAGYVRLERTGAAALDALREEAFESVACDISLPDMSGLDVITQARAIAPAIGIAAITGFVDVHVAVQSMQAGADDFPGKPFDPGILWHVLNNPSTTGASGSRPNAPRPTASSPIPTPSPAAPIAATSTSSSNPPSPGPARKARPSSRPTSTSTTSSS